MSPTLRTAPRITVSPAANRVHAVCSFGSSVRCSAHGERRERSSRHGSQQVHGAARCVTGWLARHRHHATTRSAMTDDELGAAAMAADPESALLTTLCASDVVGHGPLPPAVVCPPMGGSLVAAPPLRASQRSDDHRCLRHHQLLRLVQHLRPTPPCELVARRPADAMEVAQKRRPRRGDGSPRG